MRKRTLLAVVVLVAAISLVAVAPVSACSEGCTPGYWKNHPDSWVGYIPGDNFNSVFGVGPNMTLMEALSAKRGDFGSGAEAAFVRHAVAALLNESSGIDALGTYWLGVAITEVYENDASFEYWKNFLEWHNELGCPLN